MARLLPALPLIGGGKTRFQPVWVGDVAAAIVAALERDDAPGETYELGGPKVYSFAELMRYMLKVIGRRRLLVPLSFELARLQARVLELLPVPPLTRDQVELLKTDNVVGAGRPHAARPRHHADPDRAGRARLPGALSRRPGAAVARS